LLDPLYHFRFAGTLKDRRDESRRLPERFTVADLSSDLTAKYECHIDFLIANTASRADPNRSLFSLNWQKSVVAVLGRPFRYWFVLHAVDEAAPPPLCLELPMSVTVEEAKRRFRYNLNRECLSCDDPDGLAIGEGWGQVRGRVELKLFHKDLEETERLFDLGVAEQQDKPIDVVFSDNPFTFSFEGNSICVWCFTDPTLEEIEWNMSNRLGTPVRLSHRILRFQGSDLCLSRA
jgi:hypothetical protein